MEEAQLELQEKAAQRLCSLQTEGVCSALWPLFWRSFLVWDESPSSAAGSVGVCIAQTLLLVWMLRPLSGMMS